MSAPLRQWPLRRRLRYALETAGTYIVYGFFRLLPYRQASSLGGWLLTRLGMKMGVSRVALRNLDLSFPEKSEREKNEILRGMWNNLGRVVAEYPHLSSIEKDIEILGGENLDSARLSGKPIIFFGGHIGNWEAIPVATSRLGIDTHIVYRKPNNTGVDGLLRNARSVGAVGQIEKGIDGARQIMTVLRQGGAVAMLVDQNITGGMAVDFFGRPAMTSPGPAYFALRFDCPLYPVRVERLENGRLRVTILPPLPVVSTGDRHADAEVILKDMNALLEGWIRERPSQWLWLHRRWKGAENLPPK
jgi:KDO2-lipid IV(A) lauroyltransferase